MFVCVYYEIRYVHTHTKQFSLGYHSDVCVCIIDKIENRFEYELNANFVKKSIDDDQTKAIFVFKQTYFRL